jgi:hypothetical protein
LLVSLCVFVHAVPQKLGFAVVGQEQTPDLQVSADGQAWVQVPQLAVSLCVFVQADPQKLGLAVVGHTHVPDWQASLAAHTVVQLPQWLESPCRVVHVPLQFVSPAVQPLVHVYVEPEGLHTGVAPEQPAPHAEQFVALPRAVLHPVPVFPQSANPAAHE